MFEKKDFIDFYNELNSENSDLWSYISESAFSNYIEQDISLSKTQFVLYCRLYAVKTIHELFEEKENCAHEEEFSPEDKIIFIDFVNKLCKAKELYSMAICAWGCFGGNKLFVCNYKKSAKLFNKFLDEVLLDYKETKVEKAVFGDFYNYQAINNGLNGYNLEPLPAALALGDIYYNGLSNDGIPNYETAYQYYKLAESYNSISAKTKLADLYFKHKVGEKNDFAHFCYGVDGFYKSKSKFLKSYYSCSFMESCLQQARYAYDELKLCKNEKDIYLAYKFLSRNAGDARLAYNYKVKNTNFKRDKAIEEEISFFLRQSNNYVLPKFLEAKSGEKEFILLKASINESDCSKDVIKLDVEKQPDDHWLLSAHFVELTDDGCKDSKNSAFYLNFANTTVSEIVSAVYFTLDAGEIVKIYGEEIDEKG
ncbi:MAG: hypothetical protein MJ189_04270, partial [Coriobacteriales bacterium]|nr:hypothetical protein [Coriobacteriales bacterium]